MVPHIYASSMEDALFCKDTQKHPTDFSDGFYDQGHWRSIIRSYGTIDLAFDKSRNRSLIETTAQNAVIAWSNIRNLWNCCKRYVDGVNAYISQLKPADYPVEYKLLDFKPELWTVKKVPLFIVRWPMFCVRSDDLESTNSLAVLGRKNYLMNFIPNKNDGNLLSGYSLWKKNMTLEWTCQWSPGFNFAGPFINTTENRTKGIEQLGGVSIKIIDRQCDPIQWSPFHWLCHQFGWRAYCDTWSKRVWCRSRDFRNNDWLQWLHSMGENKCIAKMWRIFFSRCLDGEWQDNLKSEHRSKRSGRL